ncbi:MAG: BatA domain-containing protein [Planctomycetota bacterium]
MSRSTLHWRPSYAVVSQQNECVRSPNAGVFYRSSHLSFAFPTLLQFGWPLIALPLLIHLINLRRHRRVEWAAMDFLLESQKRNKNRIFLRQLILLLLRTAAIALLLCMLAGPELKFKWGQLFGQGTTHHLVLLDDSYSMSDRDGSLTAFGEAKRVLGQLLDQATQQPGDQKLTLLTFSQASEVTAGADADGLDQPINRQGYEQVVARLNKLSVAESDAGPSQAIRAAVGLPKPVETEARIVYVISDFRMEQWRQNGELADLLGQLRNEVAQLQFIQCVDTTRANLAITNLEPESGIRAAGVETWMKLSVSNFGDEIVSPVTATVTQDGHKLPAVQFESIPPGETVTRRFRVTFPTAGAHQLRTSLDSDAVEIDNTRFFACDVPLQFPVLLVDGSREGDDGYYLRTALRPSGVSKPSWIPQVEQTSFLRQHEALSDFAAICLLDVPRLDESEVAALEAYVQQGGGLGIFVGPRIQKPFYNQRLYRDGQGLLPAQLDKATQLLATSIENTPDIVVSDHPLFSIFKGQRNSFLALATVNYYYAIDPGWRPQADGKTNVLAELRNGAPFVLSKEFGAGRVVLQLSKMSPKSTDLGVWTNWSLNPVFPVYANELVGYLSASQRQLALREVGSQLVLQVPQSDYEPEVQIRLPRNKGTASETVVPQVVDGKYIVDAGRTDVSGVWEFELRPRDGTVEQRLVAINVAPDEGDLHHLDRSELAKELPDLDYKFSLASQMSAAGASFAGFPLSDTFLYVLLGTLVVEQWLAYKTSYHTGSGSPS